MADQVKLVVEFIDKAVRNLKYSNDTGSALKRAVQLFESVMQEDELESLELVKNRADAIANRVEIKWPNKYSASSLMVYKSRVLRAVNDYLRYGTDAKKMAGWSPKSVKRSQKGTTPKITQQNGHATRTYIEAEELPTNEVMPLPFIPSSSSGNYNAKTTTLDLPLKDERGVTINYPVDLTVSEAEKIGNVLKSIAQLNEG